MTPAQNDTWWHLRSGREILETRSFLTTERFSHSSFGTEIQIHWWLSQIIFYVAFVAGGPALLTVLCGSFAFGAVCGAWRLVRGAFETRIILLLFLMIATASEWAVRPQVISLALFAVTLHLIVRDRMAWLPFVCLVWANAHAVVVLGLIVVGVVALEALVWSRAKLARDGAVLVGCVLAPMVSPLGLHYWPRIISCSRNLARARPARVSTAVRAGRSAVLGDGRSHLRRGISSQALAECTESKQSNSGRDRLARRPASAPPATSHSFPPSQRRRSPR